MGFSQKNMGAGQFQDSKLVCGQSNKHVNNCFDSSGNGKAQWQNMLFGHLKISMNLLVHLLYAPILSTQYAGRSEGPPVHYVGH